jgi:hypothetical protein
VSKDGFKHNLVAVEVITVGSTYHQTAKFQLLDDVRLLTPVIVVPNCPSLLLQLGHGAVDSFFPSYHG